MKTRILILLAIAFTIANSKIASAGYHEQQLVGVSKGTTGAGYAWGMMGDAYNASDSIQFISCQVWWWAGGTFGAACSARDATGNMAQCYSYDAGAIQTVTSMTSDSQIEFYFGTDGKCTGINVMDNSFSTPKH
jgi:hypothetical protein